MFLTVQAVSAQEKSQDEEFQYFAMIYTTGENWDEGRDYHEQAYFKEHTEFLSKLRKEEKILIGGRYSDKGFMILKAKDEADALAILASDESVVNKTFKAEIFPFMVFYKGCLD